MKPPARGKKVCGTCSRFTFYEDEGEGLSFEVPVVPMGVCSKLFSPFLLQASCLNYCNRWESSNELDS